MKSVGLNAVFKNESIRDIATQTKWGTNEQLVIRALAKDPLAENAIYRQHVRYLLNLATRMTRSISDGDDVVQDTFVIAFRKLHALENPDALRPWLTRILVSRIQKRLTIRRFQSFFGFKQATEDAKLDLCAKHDARPDLRFELVEIDHVLKTVPIKWRTTWMLHRIEEMSIKETAEATNRSPATIKRYVAAVDSVLQSHRRLST